MTGTVTKRDWKAVWQEFGAIKTARFLASHDRTALRVLATESRLEKGIHQMRLGIEHHTNPLHVYCRLIDIGISRGSAMKISKVYERVIH